MQPESGKIQVTETWHGLATRPHPVLTLGPLARRGLPALTPQTRRVHEA